MAKPLRLSVVVVEREQTTCTLHCRGGSMPRCVLAFAAPVGVLAFGAAFSVSRLFLAVLHPYIHLRLSFLLPTR